MCLKTGVIGWVSKKDTVMVVWKVVHPTAPNMKRTAPLKQ